MSTLELTLDSDAIQEAIRVVSKLAPPLSEAVTIEVTGKKAYMHSNSELAACSVVMPAKVSGEATFAIQLLPLRDATKGRKELTVKYEKTLFKLRSGSYSAELATTDALKVESNDAKEEVKEHKLTAEQGAWLKSALATVALKPITSLATFMPATVRFTPKGAFVACYDTEHMSFLQSKDIQGDMDVTLPLDTWLVILDAFSKGPFKLAVGSSSLLVSNALVKVSLSLPQEEAEGVKPDQVMAMAKSASKEEGLDIELSKQEVIEFLENAKAVATKERGEIQATTENGKIKFEVTTVNGSTRATLKAKVKKATKFKVDFEFLDEAVRKCGDSVHMRKIEDSFLVFRTSKAYVLVSLNQD